MANLKRITKKLLFTKTIEILQPKLNLQDWRIVVRYSTRIKNTIADCQAQPEYRQAVIRLNLAELKNHTPYEIVATAVHEMMHCVTWPLSQFTHDLCRNDKRKIELTRRTDEAIVTHLERAFTDMAIPYLQEQLAEQGYQPITGGFENIKLMNEKPPAIRLAAKRKKRK